MKEIFKYLKDYAATVNKPVFFSCSIFTAVLIFFNFRFEMDTRINNQDSFGVSFFSRFLIYLAAFGLPYILYSLFTGKNYFRFSLFIFLLLLAPVLFSLKTAVNTDLDFGMSYSLKHFWNDVLYWPARLVLKMAILLILWKIFYPADSFFGLTTKGFQWKPYFLLLACMIPLIAAASTQPDFLDTYPKLKNIYTAVHDKTNQWVYYLLYELAYGSDFISIEVFFRGFLVLAFVRFAGKDAILPMACFYCTIHFGKPLGECISSYFGGLLLGVVVYHTKTIYGGLVVHLGIAWLMELGGWLGNYYT